jgi:DNA repair protein RecO (recombination protein O)
MLIKTTGIVLRSVKYSESSLIIDIFTRDLGLRTFIISGVRKKNSTSGAALLQISNIIEFVSYNNENSKINRIKEVRVSQYFNKLSFEIMRFSVALFILEVLSKTIKEKEINHELYDFILKVLIHIDQSEVSTINIHLTSLYQMTKYLGFFPENNFSNENPVFDLREGKFIPARPFHDDYAEDNEAQLISAILRTDIHDSHTLKLTQQSRQKILETLILYYKIHLVDFGRLKTLEVFKNIFTTH